MSQLRAVLLGTLVILALVPVAQATVTYNAILEWTGPYFRVINYPGVDQLVNNPAVDIPFVQPYAVAAREHGVGQRDVVYVVDSGHNRVQAFEVNAVYLTDNSFTWQAGGVAGANDYDDNEIYLNEWAGAAGRWIIPHSEVVLIDGVRWTWVADLTGFTAADKVYTVNYTDGTNAPEIVFPANSLTSSTSISLRYALTDNQGAVTDGPGIGDVDYGTSNGATPVLTRIDETSGGPTSWQGVHGIALSPNEATATSDDVFLIDPADNSVNQNEKLFYYTIAVAGTVTYREAYDDGLTNPYGVAVATGGTETAGAAVLGGAGTIATLAAVRDANQLTGHVYTIAVAGGNVTITDGTTGRILVNGAALADMAASYLGIPGVTVTIDNAAGAGTNTITTTRPVVDRYLFVADTGGDRIKVISASDDTPTATDDWLPGDAHTGAAQPAGAGLVGATADEDYYYTTPGTATADYSVWTNTYPIKEGTLGTITFDPAGTPVTWTRVEDLSIAKPSDKVYMVDWTTGKITFGDGVHGALPPTSTDFSFTYTTTPDVIRYGSTGTGQGRFAAPRGIAARWNASLGVFDVYVADTGNNRIQKLAFHPADAASNLPARMEYVCQWTTAGSVSDYLNSPVSVAVALDNQTLATSQSCYVAVGDQGNNRVVVFKDTAAMSGGGATVPTWDSTSGSKGTSLGKYVGVDGVTFLRNGNDLDVYACDALRGTVTKYTEAPSPSIGVTNFSGTGTCYPPASSYAFTFTTTNPPSGGTIDIYYDTASTFNESTARLCVAAGSVPSSATTATWVFANTPGGRPADGAAYYIFFRMKDASGATVATDQTSSSELFCLDSTLSPTIKGTDPIDSDYTLYLQNGIKRVIDLQVAYPDSIIAVGFGGTFDQTLLSITGITPGNGWDVPDIDNTQTIFNQAYSNTDGTYEVNTSVLGSQVGLVTTGPHTLAHIAMEVKPNAIDGTTRFRNSTFTLLTASSGMKNIHGEAPTTWRSRNVNLRFGYLGDIATTGSGADSVLPHLAPKPDGKINFDDQMIFTLGWNGVDGVQDKIADLGPTEGTAPDLQPVPDDSRDVEDVLAFTVMYSWAASVGYYRDAPGGPLPLKETGLPRPEPLGCEVKGAAEAYTVSHLDQPKAGETMSVDLMVGGAEELSGALLNLAYDPSRLELVSVADGGFLDGEQGCMFFHREGNGWVEITASRLDKVHPGISGSGTVATLTFRIIDENAGNLDLNYDLRSTRGIVLSRGDRQLGSYSGAPAGFQLFAAHPNPARGTTSIVYSLPASGGAALKVYDVSGRCVRTLASGQQQSGYHVAVFDGRNDRGDALPAGVYFYRLEAQGKQVTQKLIMAH